MDLSWGIEHPEKDSETMKVLLDLWWDTIPITPGWVRRVASLEAYLDSIQWQGLRTRALLRCQSAPSLTGETVVEIGRSFGGEEATSVLGSLGQDYQITRRVIRAAARLSKGSRTEILWLLMRRSKDNTYFSEEAMAEIAGNFDEELIDLMLDRTRRRFETSIGRRIVRHIFCRWGESIKATDELVRCAAECHDPSVMQLLVDRLRPARLIVRAELIKAAGQVQPVNNEVVHLLLSQVSEDDHITDGAITQIAKYFDAEILSRALSNRAKTEKCLEAAISCALEYGISRAERLRI
jgi:hypothetical protein